MIEAFGRLHRNPYFFRLLVQTMLYDPELTVTSAVAQVRDRIAADLRYPDAWLALSPIQRETAGALARGESRPFSRGVSRRARHRARRGHAFRGTRAGGASAA